MEADPVIAQQFGDLLETTDWALVWPTLLGACTGVLLTMWVAIILIRKIARILIALVASVACVAVIYMIVSNQITSKVEIIFAAANLGAMAAVISIPALSLKKDK